MNALYTRPWEKIDKPIIALIDTSALVHRAFHAIPHLTDSRGRPINAVYGFVSSILAVLEQVKPRYLVCALDVKGKLVRSEKYEQYKAQRKPTDENLKSQFPIVTELIDELGIPHFGVLGSEADDVIGTLAKQAQAQGVFAVIVTGDMDALQLVNGNVAVLSVTKGAKELTWYDTQSVIDKYGLKPDQLRDYKGLVGDASDNIPGVPGVGPKTAEGLLREFGDLDTLYKALEKPQEKLENRNSKIGESKSLVSSFQFLISDRLRAKLLEYKDQAYLSRELGTIDVHVPIELDLAEAIAKNYSQERATKYFETLGFKSLIRRLPEQIVMVKQESLF